MAWDNDEIIITIKDPDTGDYDDTTYTVEVYPTTGSYPTGKVNCTQLASLHDYKPDSDLDEDTHYWVRVDKGGGTVLTHKLPAKNSEPSLGAGPA